MAGDWIKMQKSLPRDPRVVRISSALKADRLRTVGGLLSAWCLFDEQTEDGRLEGYTPELMDEIVGFPGLALAMESVGWLEIGDGFLMVPRFEEHNGKSAKRRAQDSERKTSARKADKCPQEKRTESGPEKRREEINIDTPCTEAEAWQFAKGLHQLPPWTEQAVTKWYSTRASSHWTKGGVNQFPITKATWKEDLRSSHSWATQQTTPNANPKYTPRPATRNATALPAGLPSLNDTAENSRMS